MYYSKTDRAERTFPAERPFAYRTRRTNVRVKYWHVFGETTPPTAVTRRSALDARNDNGGEYARELLNPGARSVAPPRARRAVEVTRIPRRELSREEKIAEAKRELAKALAAVEKAKAAAAALNK